MQRVLPCANDAFLAALRVERLAQAVDSIIDLVDIGICDLKRLCIAVDGTNGLLNYLSTGLQAHQRALDLPREPVEFVEVSVQYLDLGTLLGVGGVPGSHHGAYQTRESRQAESPGAVMSPNVGSGDVCPPVGDKLRTGRVHASPNQEKSARLRSRVT